MSVDDFYFSILSGIIAGLIVLLSQLVGSTIRHTGLKIGVIIGFSVFLFVIFVKVLESRRPNKIVGDSIMVTIYGCIKKLFTVKFRELFPNYKQLRIEQGITDERVGKIRQELDNVKFPCYFYVFLLVIIIALMIFLIWWQDRNSAESLIRIVVFYFQLGGLVIGLIGTFILAKGFVKSADQIALESNTYFNYNTHLMKSLIFSRVDTVAGLIFIAVSFLFQVMSFIASIVT